MHVSLSDTPSQCERMPLSVPGHDAYLFVNIKSKRCSFLETFPSSRGIDAEQRQHFVGRGLVRLAFSSALGELQGGVSRSGLE